MYLLTLLNLPQLLPQHLAIVPVDAVWCRILGINLGECSQLMPVGCTAYLVAYLECHVPTLPRSEA